MKINILRKNYILIGIIAMLTLIMGLTYAVFVISSDSYRASEMYIGNLLYGIEITNEDDTTDNINNLTVTLSPNEERTIKVKVNSLNPVNSKYKLQYTTSNNIEVKYTSDTPNPVIGDIEKENNPNDEVEIYIYLKNNENINTTITFGVKGGYNHNTSTSIELLPSYLAIIDEYTERDLILAITIDGDKEEDLPDTGYFNLSSYECENGSTLEWKSSVNRLIMNNSSFPEKCSLNFVSTNHINLTDAIYESNTIITKTPDFNQIVTSADSGIYSAEDDYGTSYYFRGNKDILNNNVIFGGYQWKVIRITGSGDIKMIYNGTQAQFNTNGTVNSSGTNTIIGASVFNSSLSDNRSVGYMYGNTCTTYETCHANEVSSTLKTALDTWYSNNILNKGVALTNKIADTIYCNDRSIYSGSGVGTTSTFYNGRKRMYLDNPITTLLKCPQKNDAFTVDDVGNGNGALTYPIGTITSDEIIYAGSKVGQRNVELYLSNSLFYWTITPNTGASYSYTYEHNENGTIGFGARDNTMSNNVRPVIALKSNVTISSGNGSATSPFVISE